MKKCKLFPRIVCFFLAFALIPVCVGATQVTNDIQQPTGQNSTLTFDNSLGIDATTTLLGDDKKVENVQAAALFEANSGTLMYTWKADAKMYPASLVKILTALIALEEGTPSVMVTVSEEAVSSVPADAVSVDLIPGEQLSLIDLVYCMMVGSGNDAAAVIAEHISGSQAAFVAKMNDYAQRLGCANTKFTNPHGLHDDEQYTTARDIIRILAEAAKNELFLEVFTTKEHTVEATNKSDRRSMQTGNFMVDSTSKLYYDPRVLGGRTGVTEDGRRCLATIADHNGMRLLCVVMGTESEYQEDGYSAISIGGYKETTTLLDAGSNGYQTAQIIYANQALRQCEVVNGSNHVVMGPKTSVITILPGNISLENLTFQYSDLTLQAPVSVGDKVSSVRVFNGNICVAQADLYAMNSVERADNLQVIDGSGDGNAVLRTVLVIILSVAVCIVAALFVVRGVGKMRLIAAKKRKNRYHRSHRRSR